MPDLDRMTWFGREIKSGWDEGYSSSLAAARLWMREVGALEIEDVPPVRCSSSESTTFCARFEWRPTAWLRVTVYVCTTFSQVTVHLEERYGSARAMMSHDAARYVENGRHKLDRLDARYAELLGPELRTRWERETCGDTGVFGGDRGKL